MNKVIQELNARRQALLAHAQELAKAEGDNSEELTKVADEMEAINRKLDALRRADAASQARAVAADGDDDDVTTTGEGGEDDDAPADEPSTTTTARARKRGSRSSVADFAKAARAGFRVRNTAPDLTGVGNTGADADGGYTVPEDIVTRVETYRESKASLRDLVSVETVSAPSGRRTFKKRAQQTGFVQVGEGGRIPKKATPQFEVKNYSVSKYAGFFAITNELLADSDENITNTLVQWIGDEARVTDNTLILAAIKRKTAVALDTLSGIKRALYVTLDAAFRGTSSIVTNASGVYWLSELKDANGRELLQPIPSDPGKMQLAIGARVFPVHELPDADLPNDGTKIPFILGDLKAGIRVFDRKKLTLSASDVAVAGDFNAYEQDMMLTKAVERLDVQQWDDTAYLYGTVETATTPASDSGTT